MTGCVSLVVVNYRGRWWLPRCLHSLSQLEGPIAETLVVDNASGDGSAEGARWAFPHVRVLRNRQNTGFAAACNQAMRETRGDYVGIFNNDVKVDSRWLVSLLEVMEAGPLIAAACGKLRRISPRPMLASAGVCMNWQGFGYDRGRFEWDTGQYDRPEPIFAVSGAAMLIRRSVYEAVGPFDERFFLYHEDVDWCWRAWLSGFTIWYAPQAGAHHKVGASSRRYLGRTAPGRFGQRYRVRSLLKCYEWQTLRRLLPQLSKSWQGWVRLGPSLAWNVWHLPSTLAERRRIQRLRLRSDREVEALIWPSTVPCVLPRGNIATRLRSQRHPLPVSVMEVGINDAAVLGNGWHDPEPAPDMSGLLVRRSQPHASVQLWQPVGATRLVLHVYGDTQTIPLSLHLSLNGRTLASFDVNRCGWIELECPIEAPLKGRWITIGLASQREAGVGLRRMGCLPALPAVTIGNGRETPPVSVIIPTRNRSHILEKTLRGLLRQRYPDTKMEIVVVDDGSADETPVRVADLQRTALGRLRYLRQEPRGASAARNRGIEAARYDLLVFLDDDVIPDDQFVAAHVEAHQRLNRHRDVAVVGSTRWPQGQRLTAFQRYLSEWGPQFCSRLMQEDFSLPWYCFYSSNVSLYRETCGALVRFDESFPFYWYDTELSYRLAQRGLQIFFAPRCIGYHHHERGYQAFAQRQTLVGRYAVLLADRYPELANWLRIVNPRARRTRQGLRGALESLAQSRRHAAPALAMRWYQWRLFQAYQRGVEEGRRGLYQLRHHTLTNVQLLADPPQARLEASRMLAAGVSG